MKFKHVGFRVEDKVKENMENEARRLHFKGVSEFMVFLWRKWEMEKMKKEEENG